MKRLLALALFFTTSTFFAQGVITGTVIDSQMDAPLPGANVSVVGTTKGGITDFGGKFSIEVDKASGFIEVTFLGFEPKRVAFQVTGGNTVDLGRILLTAGCRCFGRSCYHNLQHRN